MTAGTIRQTQGSLFPGVSPACEDVNVTAVCLLLADGGARGGLCGSRPGRLPVRSGFIRQRLHGGCCLHAPRHGHRNRKRSSLSEPSPPTPIHIPNPRRLDLTRPLSPSTVPSTGPECLVATRSGFMHHGKPTVQEKKGPMKPRHNLFNNPYPCWQNAATAAYF